MNHIQRFSILLSIVFIHQVQARREKGWLDDTKDALSKMNFTETTESYLISGDGADVNKVESVTTVDVTTAVVTTDVENLTTAINGTTDIMDGSGDGEVDCPSWLWFCPDEDDEETTIEVDNLLITEKPEKPVEFSIRRVAHKLFSTKSETPKKESSFFVTSEHKFSDVKVKEQKGFIKVEPFLDATRSLFMFGINSVEFKPSFFGNLANSGKSMGTDAVEEQLENTRKAAKSKNTDNLIDLLDNEQGLNDIGFLKDALWMTMYVFEGYSNDKKTTEIWNNAYEKSGLKPKHAGWIHRIFNAVSNVAPDSDDLVNQICLANEKTHPGTECDREIVFKHIKNYTPPIKTILDELERSWPDEKTVNRIVRKYPMKKGGKRNKKYRNRIKQVKKYIRQYSPKN